MKTSTRNIEKIRKKLKEKVKNLQETQLNGVRELLANKTINDICRECGYTFRNRLLSPVLIVQHETFKTCIKKDGA